MDFPGSENLQELATWAAEIFSVYAVKAKEKIADAATDAVTEKTGQAWQWLKDRFAGEQAEESLLDEMENSSEPPTRELENILLSKMKRDESFAEFIALLEELGRLAPQSTTIDNSQTQVATGNKGTTVQIQGNKNQTHNS